MSTSSPSSILLQPFQLTTQQLKNRVVSVPVFTGYAQPDGKVSRMLLEHYKRLAGAGVGMVIVANTAVAKDGVTSFPNLRLDHDRYVPGLAKLAAAIKQAGAVACLQLNHGGRFAKTEQPLLPSPIDGTHLAFDVASLKAFMEYFPFEERFRLTRTFMNMALAWQRAMTTDEMQRVRTQFGQAATRVAQAGFDMVELHGANGYLITQFLSAYTNKLVNKYGGTLHKRFRYPLEVLKTVQQSLPQKFPVGFRLILDEWVPEGITVDEAIAFAKELAAHGVAYLSPAAGTYNSLFNPKTQKNTAKPGFLRHSAARLKQEVNLPVILSGRMLSHKLAENILRNNEADLIGLGRPLIADIDWLRKLDTRKKILACKNCNQCLRQAVQGAGLSCLRWPEKQKKRTALERRIVVRNGYSRLVVATSKADLDIMRNHWCVLQPRQHETVLKLLFILPRNAPRAYQQALDEFEKDVQEMECALGHASGSIQFTKQHTDQDRGQLVTAIAEREHFGSITLCRNPDEPWRERLVQINRFGFVTLLGTAPHNDNVLVPFDMSEASLFVLSYAQHAFADMHDTNIHFVHVLESGQDRQTVQNAWDHALEILDWDSTHKLLFLRKQQTVAEELLTMARKNNFGSIVMGKRGLTGLKSLFLGSVSAAVMQGAKERTITIVD